MYPAAEKGVAKSTRVAKSIGALEHGLSTDLDEEADKLARENAALGSGPHDIGV